MIPMVSSSQLRCMRLSMIAEQCGYNNENHFLRQFKEKSGWTAAQFRRENVISEFKMSEIIHEMSF